MSEFATRRVMMVDTQVRPSDVTKFPIIDAMLTVPRETFVPDDKREVAYVGENLPLAPGPVVPEARTLVSFLPFSTFTSRSLSREWMPMIMPW